MVLRNLLIAIVLCISVFSIIDLNAHMYFTASPDSIEIGEIHTNETWTSVNPIKIKNEGTFTCDFGLRLIDPAFWEAGYTPAVNSFTLRARFSSDTFPPVEFSPALDFVKTSTTWASDLIFGPEGIDLSPNDSVNLWLQFLSPAAASYCDTGTIKFKILGKLSEVLDSVHTSWDGDTIKLFINLICDPVDIEESSINKSLPEFSLKAYPNPFNSSCRIEAPEGSAIEIYDINGRMIFSYRQGCLSIQGIEEDQSASLPFSSWIPLKSTPAGIYFVKASSHGENRIIKVLFLK